MRTRISRPTLSAIVLTLAAIPILEPAARGQKTFKSDRFGFELKIPKDFHEVPINLDEKWVVAKFLYKRELEAKKAWLSLTPEIRVIVFPKFDPKDLAKKAIKKKGGRMQLFAQMENPYKNYKEYMRQNYRGSGGGWHVAKESTTKINGLVTTYKKIEVNRLLEGEEGLANIIHAWEIDYGDAIYVVHCEGLADHDRKFRGIFRGGAKRFKKITRTESVTAGFGPTTPVSGAASKKDKVKKGPKTAAEKFKDKQLELARIKEKAKSRLPSGWGSFEKAPFLVVYNKKVTTRFAKKVCKQATLVWKWLDKNFGYIGADRAVGGVLRVCNNRAEASAYVDTSGKSAYSARSREIVVYKDRNYGFSTNGWYMNVGIVQRWLADKNNRLWWSLPPWLDDGLVYYIGNLRVKGSKVLSKPDEWDMEAVRNAMRKDEYRPTEELIKARYGKGYNSTKDRVQALALAHYLMTRGARHAKHKKIIPTYLSVLDRRTRDLQKEWERSLKRAVEEASSGKKDDGEKEAWYSKWKKKRDKIYEECLKECFGSWSSTDWKNLDTAWKKAFKR